MQARKNDVAVPRVYPRFVDVGSLDHPVRFDTGRSLYDLRDAFTAAYGNDRAWRTASKSLGKNFGLGDAGFARVKWSDQDANTGTGRVMVDAATCGRVLRGSVMLHKRAHITVDQVALWFENQAETATQPTLLLATESSHGISNQRE